MCTLERVKEMYSSSTLVTLRYKLMLAATGEYICEYLYVWEVGKAYFPHKKKTTPPCM